jgi:hypothetical protein
MVKVCRGVQRAAIDQVGEFIGRRTDDTLILLSKDAHHASDDNC